MSVLLLLVNLLKLFSGMGKLKTHLVIQIGRLLFYVFATFVKLRYNIVRGTLDLIWFYDYSYPCLCLFSLPPFTICDVLNFFARSA